MLTDRKIELIRELMAQTSALLTRVNMGEPSDKEKVAAAYMAMLTSGVNEEDIMAFSRKFPETHIGISLPGPPNQT
jgi:hypothetical protein